MKRGICLLTLTALAAPAMAKAPALVGEWEVAAGEENGKRMALPPHLQLRFDFKKGGKLVQTRVVNGKKSAVEGRWEVKDSTITLTLGNRQVMAFSVDANVLTLTLPGNKSKMLLQHPGSNAVKITADDRQAAKEGFDTYLRKSKAVEATENLDKMQLGARSYFVADHFSKTGGLLPPGFPPGSTAWVPPAPCCKQPKGTCAPDPKIWESEPWRSLFFQISDPYRYQYRYRAQGTGKRATVTLEARGDLNCDGKFSSYTVTGKVGADAKPSFGEPVVVDPLE